jgi:deoxyhypusine synthase
MGQLNINNLPEVRGHNFANDFSFEEFIQSYSQLGFQASCLHEAIRILRVSRSKKIPIYLGITSNIGTCGLRDSIRYLTVNRHIAAIVATAGAIEEDVMKTMGSFRLGDYKNDDISLYKSNINRSGNILIPAKLYLHLHLFLNAFNSSLWRRFWIHGDAVTDSDYVYEMGRYMDTHNIPLRDQSFVYKAYKNDIRIYSPALLDGAIGDALYNFSAFRRRLSSRPHRRPIIEVSKSAADLIDHMIDLKTVHGDICLLAVGGSVPKHMICNSAIYAGGAKYCVYINTSTEAEGSNAGAPVSEAITWGKVRVDAQAVKVEAEASLVLPLIIAAAFKVWDPPATI